MAYPRSPLFPDASLALSPGRPDEPSTLLPQLPQLPQILTSTLQVYIVPAEKHLFVQGFKPAEFETRPPTLLRGALVVRVLKPNKIKAINLSFRGIQKTDWPEGIPPRRHFYNETNDLVHHSWPFYQQETHVPGFGADIVVSTGKNGAPDDVTHLSLDTSGTSGTNGFNTTTSSHLAVPELTLFAASLMKMATSTTHSLSPVNSFADLSAVLSSLQEKGDTKPGYFPAGDYVYNFEHPIPALSPETVLANFGTVNYYLETTIQRLTTFKSNLSARLPIEVVRIPSDNSVEENEPIIIERDWEDQLRYEIVVASKSVVLDTYLPILLRFIPLFGKVALHRIRIYITEDCNYYCSNKSVHRTEPLHKYLLLEHKAKKNQSLLTKNGGRAQTFDPEDEVLPRELEFQLFVPSTVNKKFDYTIHPDTAVENIQCHHWIKISLRISKQDPQNPEKRKHFEILIDSPIHLFSPLAAHNNTLLPVYTSGPEYLPEYTQLPPMSPGVTAIDASNQQTSLLLLAVFGNTRDPSESSPRPSTPIQFQHISSTMDNLDPIQRENDMHLDANLYLPENEEMLSNIGSPQATAFSPVASPVGSPVRNPPEPSMEPPLFSIMGVTEDTLPPAYEQETSLMNLSPLRLDATTDPSHESSLNTVGIKDKLNKLFETRGRKSSSGKTSLKSNRSSSQSTKSHRDSQEGVSTESTDKTEQNPISKTIEGATTLQKPTENGRRSSVSSKHSIKRNHSNIGVPQIDTDATTKSEDQVNDGPSTDITDLGSPSAHLTPNSFSRRSSVSLCNYRNNLPNDSDLDLTLPLLSLSTTRNDARLLIDSGRNYDPMGSMTDIVASHRFDELRVPSSLTHFRNPRLNKHYQEDAAEEDENILKAFGKPRQKSFGVLPHINKPTSQLDDETDDSKTTLSEFSHSSKDTPYKIGKEAQRMMSN